MSRTTTTTTNTNMPSTTQHNNALLEEKMQANGAMQMSYKDIVLQ
jgi:hypothetical protein